MELFFGLTAVALSAFILATTVVSGQRNRARATIRVAGNRRGTAYDRRRSSRL